MAESNACMREPENEGTTHHSRQDQLVEIADNTLAFFTDTATDAKAKLAGSRPPSPDVFAAMNSLTTERAMQNLAGISGEERRVLEIICQEPAIARVVALNEKGDRETIFIARGTTRPKTAGVKVASYRSPLGRLAALPVGSWLDYDTPSGERSLQIIEKAALKPSFSDDLWDSVDSVVHSTAFSPVTIGSFRALLRPIIVEESDFDVLEAILSEGATAENVIEGIQRNLITKMGLRDQPLLDQFQDEVFRLHISNQIVLLGPPGSGKTTTLIRRLGQKTDLEHLDKGELALIDQTVAGQQRHAQSWIMFTPTELLKLYVKEAFAREAIPASDQRIWTWNDYRRDLARNRLGILRTASGAGRYILKEELLSLQPSTVQDQTTWFDDFNAWQANAFWTELKQHADKLASDPDQIIAKLGRQLTRIVARADVNHLGPSFNAIADLAEEIQSLISRLRTETDRKIKEVLGRELKKDRTLLDGLMTFLGTLNDSNDDSDDQDGEDDEEIRPLQKAGKEAALDAYMRAVRALARASAAGRSLGRQSRNAKIIEWAGEHLPTDAELQAIGVSVLVQTSARNFVNPLNRYLNRIPNRYRRFRRERQGEGRWYQKDGFTPNDLAPLEADAILLAMLRAARSLLQDRRILREIELPRHTTLKSVQDLYRTQVLVDEATDFSPLQLGCMAALCDPATNAFLACGDFNQRITEWGSRSAEDLRWVFPRIDIRSINITYRHSRQLNELARNIVLISNPDAPEAQLPADVNSDAVPPVRATNLSDPAEIAVWLANRITEIEKLTKTLPSIAVLVNSEGEIKPVTEALNKALSGHNIRAVGCPGGQVVGQENDVRVFDVQHIKGLEFEAVFFLGIDRLAEQEPNLFDKYLYVGATRAATYLGVTTAGPALPISLAPLEGAFGNQWP